MIMFKFIVERSYQLEVSKLLMAVYIFGALYSLMNSGLLIVVYTICIYNDISIIS